MNFTPKKGVIFPENNSNIIQLCTMFFVRLYMLKARNRHIRELVSVEKNEEMLQL